MRIAPLTLILILALTSCMKNQKEYKFQDATLPTNKRVENLLSVMTLAEKVGQLNLLSASPEHNTIKHIQEEIKAGRVGSLLKSNGAEANAALQKIAVEETRLGIPIMFQEDVIHGYKTIFPAPMAEACSWNLEAIEQSARIAAVEASSSGIHLTYAPMVDICRDPRWGRIVEGAGEDPYLASLIAKARVVGFQGKQISDSNTIISCPKHFLGYGSALAGKDYAISDFSEREMREIYLPPFRAAIQAGAKSMMTAYTAVNGVPVTSNKNIAVNLLRKELGFKGMLITDWATISNLVKTGVATNNQQAAELAINAQVDVDMVSTVFVKNLVELVKQKIISEKQIDEAVARVLELKFELGLFDDPYKYFNVEREKNTLMHPIHIDFAIDAACESMVLLKNQNNILPIDAQKIKKIAVIGPLAQSKIDMLSWWGTPMFSQVDTNDVVTILEGIKARNNDTEVVYEQGIILDGFEKKGTNLIPDAVKTAKEADVVVLVLGEKHWMSGEGASISNIDLPGAQEDLLNAVSKTGKPIISVIVSGRPYDLRYVVNKSQAVVQAWQPGIQAGTAVAKILFGDYNPTGKLVVTFPQNTGQIPIYYNTKRGSHDIANVDFSQRFVNNYKDISFKPLFPFGYGLSYTEFQYSNFKIQGNNVSVTVKNSGQREGVEIVQFYIKDVVTEVTTPQKRLFNFERLSLKPGESKTINFKIEEKMLEYIGIDLQPKVDSGVFEIMVGPNSEELKILEYTFVKD